MKIQSKEENIRLDQYLARELDISRSKIQKDIKEGLVKVNGKNVNSSFLLSIDDEIEIPVQVTGKVKATVSIALDTDEAIVKEKVHENQSVKNAISDKNIVKEIYIKNKIYNIVVK